MTEQEYLEAVEEDLGWCTNCQSFTTSCCEPDARNYRCEECEQDTVFGAEEALIAGLFTFDED